MGLAPPLAVIDIFPPVRSLLPCGGKEADVKLV